MFYNILCAHRKSAQVTNMLSKWLAERLPTGAFMPKRCCPGLGTRDCICCKMIAARLSLALTCAIKPHGNLEAGWNAFDDARTASNEERKPLELLTQDAPRLLSSCPLLIRSACCSTLYVARDIKYLALLYMKQGRYSDAETSLEVGGQGVDARAPGGFFGSKFAKNIFHKSKPACG
jgi:hypothetical protein